jgi:UDP-4-amino-4,6-dideoxy-N-acetyl-beta-L-altrosamine transaminase
VDSTTTTEVATSVRENFLPFCQPDIGENEIEEVVQTLRSGWLTTGPKTKEFERRFGEYVGARHAIAVNSCTAGLHLALAAAGIGEGDEVITTPLTFCATANVIIHQRATPILADVREDDFNINPEEVERRITPRTKAIIPVHLAGQPCEMDEILRIAEKHHLLVIEDAAHAVGAKYNGRMIGTIGDVTAFSFYATKNLTTAEGGMITTDNQGLAEKMRILSLHGISADAWKRYSAEGSWYYEVLYPGYKYNMTDIQASLGIHQLARLEGFIQTRARYAQMYTEAFSEMPEIIVLQVGPKVRHAWHLYVIRINRERLKINRAQFIEALRTENIGASVHFIPLHLHPFYQEQYGFEKGDFPVAEAVYENIISLPFYTKMTAQDVEDVIEAVRHTVVQYRK